MSDELRARIERLEREVAELRALNDRRFVYLARGFPLFHDELGDLRRDWLALLGPLLRDGVVTEADVDATRDQLDIKFAVAEVTEPEHQAMHEFRDQLHQELKRLEPRDEAPA